MIAHRLVFSMSKEQNDALTDAGINPDQVLHSTMKKVMRKFNERFHPNDSIGCAYGIHHDTANLHVHVAICPRTANFRAFVSSCRRVSGRRVASRPPANTSSGRLNAPFNPSTRSGRLDRRLLEALWRAARLVPLERVKFPQRTKTLTGLGFLALFGVH